MQEAVPHLRVLAPWDQHRELGVAISEDLVRHLQSSVGHAAVGALDDVEREAGEAEVTPRLDEHARLPRVEIEVDGA